MCKWGNCPDEEASFKARKKDDSLATEAHVHMHKHTNQQNHVRVHTQKPTEVCAQAHKPTETCVQAQKHTDQPKHHRACNRTQRLFGLLANNQVNSYIDQITPPLIPPGFSNVNTSRNHSSAALHKF